MSKFFRQKILLPEAIPEEYRTNGGGMSRTATATSTDPRPQLTTVKMNSNPSLRSSNVVGFGSQLTANLSGTRIPRDIDETEIDYLEASLDKVKQDTRKNDAMMSLAVCSKRTPSGNFANL